MVQYIVTFSINSYQVFIDNVSLDVAMFLAERLRSSSKRINIKLQNNLL